MTLGNFGSERCSAFVVVSRLQSRKYFKEKHRLCILNDPVDILHNTQSSFYISPTVAQSIIIDISETAKYRSYLIAMFRLSTYSA
jgi:hypothetical protein